MYLSPEKAFKRPQRLRTGDKIAIIAPSSPIDSQQLLLGIDIIKSKNLHPVLGDNIRFFRSRGLYSATLEDRIAEFLWALEDESVSGIIIGTGGAGCARLLPYLSYDLIKIKAKTLMGFSDTTALNNGILAKAGLISFNGPSASIRYDTEEHRQTDSQALSDALDLLMSQEPWSSRPFVRNRLLPRCVCPGIAEGPAVGGNLTTFTNLLGTPFFPDINGTILFLEDIREGGYEISRTLDHLALAGVFDRVAGIVFGEFSCAPEKVPKGDPSIDDVIVDFFKNGPPCIYGLNFSHGDTGAVIPIGSTTFIDAINGTVSFDYTFDV
jgi:muramoyltetrapeptide carboxypeptidase